MTVEPETMTVEPEAIRRLTRDLRLSAGVLGPEEARFVVDYYYRLQEDRIRAGHQERQLAKAEEPHQLISWAQEQNRILETQVIGALNVYSDSQVVGHWSKSIVGIGPVLSAGLLAHIDITRAPTVGHIWRFAGLDPTVTWEKGKKRPWNADLKVLCWKIGESFVKQQNNPKDIYGHVYAARRALEDERNQAGEYQEQAQAKLQRFRIGTKTEAFAAYSAGQLPPGHVYARAKRYTVKLFLSHWHHVAYEAHYGTPPPKPYVLEHMGHVDFFAPPNWP